MRLEKLDQMVFNIFEKFLKRNLPFRLPCTQMSMDPDHQPTNLFSARPFRQCHTLAGRQKCFWKVFTRSLALPKLPSIKMVKKKRAGQLQTDILRQLESFPLPLPSAISISASHVHQHAFHRFLRQPLDNVLLQTKMPWTGNLRHLEGKEYNSAH